MLTTGSQEDAEEQERLSQAKAQEVKRHVDGLCARAAEGLRECLAARQQAAAEAAEKEEGHNRQKQERGKAKARWSPAAPLRSRLENIAVDISVRKIHVQARLADTSGYQNGARPS